MSAVKIVLHLFMYARLQILCPGILILPHSIVFLSGILAKGCLFPVIMDAIACPLRMSAKGNLIIRLKIISEPYI
jgi:hypothetical protein